MSSEAIKCPDSSYSSDNLSFPIASSEALAQRLDEGYCALRCIQISEINNFGLANDAQLRFGL